MVRSLMAQAGASREPRYIAVNDLGGAGRSAGAIIQPPDSGWG